MPEPMTPEQPLSPQQLEGLYKTWSGEIQDALSREKKYRQTAQRCVDLYEAKNPDETPFAILYSNVEVLAPAVYNARPIPIVQRRYKDSDPIGKAVCDVSTRMLKYLIDTESANYDSFDDLMQPAVLDGLITNRGLTRFKFVSQNNSMPECVYGEAVRWDKFFHGYARTWKKVPWIGFEWDMTEDEIRKNFPDMPLDFRALQDLDEDAKEPEPRDQLKGVKLAKVYEIWDKRSRRVYFFSPCYTKGPLRMVDDPLGLLGFFPVPRPLNFMRKVTTLVPTPLYEHYRQQAQELNEITKRLKAIIRAIKYRGAYNSAVEGIEKMLKAEDNELVPVENVQSMPDGTGMDKLLWTVPVQELAQTAQSLYQQRESVKQVIYEITGISDILRGASVASETATAQQIKNQWGSLRLKKMQKEVQRYCREALGIMLEIACNKFDLQTIVQMTGAPYQSVQEKQQIAFAAQQQAMQAQMAQQGQPQPGQPPMLPAPAGGPPALPAALQAELQQPAWEQIYALMQNEVASHYKTDIETNSTIDAEAAQDKQDIAELLNALSQFLNGLGPLVEKGLMPFDIAKEMLLVISRRYNFGSQLEDSLLAMTQPQPQTQADPAADAKAEQAKAEAAAKTQQAQIAVQMSQMEFEQKKALMQLQAQIDMLELQMKEKELNLQMRAVEMKLRVQEAQHVQKLQQIAAQSAASEASEKEPAHAAV